MRPKQYFGKDDQKILYAVTRVKGPGWDPNRPMTSQVQWLEHASVMNQLAADGFIKLGGPIGYEGKVLLIFDVEEEHHIAKLLERDPWSDLRILDIEEVQDWAILLEAAQTD